MDARPLRELLAGLTGDARARQAYGEDPAGYLAAHGHPGLPEPLVAEAVVSFAHTAPVEVAEVLAPYVMANGPIPGDEPSAEWVDLLSGAPGVGENPFDETVEQPERVADWADPAELDFGAGAGAEFPAGSVTPETGPAAAESGAIAPGEPAPAEPEWIAGPEFAPEPPIAGLGPEAEAGDDPLE